MVPGQFDVITAVDTMDHWHNSPKRLFREVLAKLKPDGALIVSVPNCVNIKKPLMVPIGYGKWSSMKDWYASETKSSSDMCTSPM